MSLTENQKSKFEVFDGCGSRHGSRTHGLPGKCRTGARNKTVPVEARHAVAYSPIVALVSR